MIALRKLKEFTAVDDTGVVIGIREYLQFVRTPDGRAQGERELERVFRSLDGNVVTPNADGSFSVHHPGGVRVVRRSPLA